MGRGLYRHVPNGDPAAAHAQALKLPAGTTVLESLQRAFPHSWFSHHTAAQLYGIREYGRPGQQCAVHMSGSFTPRTHFSLEGIIRHKPRRVISGEIVRLGILRVSSPARLFIEMSGLLEFKDVVALGDELVRQPRHVLEGRSSPWTSVGLLQRAVEAHPGRAGIVRAREAVELVRVGSDSPAETYLRLRMWEAGLPAPELQVRLNPEDPLSLEADLGYRRWKVAIQYEGGHHFTAEQQAKDERRNAAFESAGWIVLRVNRVDLREDFVSFLRRLRLHIGRETNE